MYVRLQKVFETLWIDAFNWYRSEKIRSWGQWDCSQATEKLWEECIRWKIIKEESNERNDDWWILETKEEDSYFQELGIG